jgi:hypothetical protein
MPNTAAGGSKAFKENGSNILCYVQYLVLSGDIFGVSTYKPIFDAGDSSSGPATMAEVEFRDLRWAIVVPLNIEAFVRPPRR